MLCVMQVRMTRQNLHVLITDAVFFQSLGSGSSSVFWVSLPLWIVSRFDPQGQREQREWRAGSPVSMYGK